VSHATAPSTPATRWTTSGGCGVHMDLGARFTAAASFCFPAAVRLTSCCPVWPHPTQRPPPSLRRGAYAHCLDGLARFFAEDVSFLQAQQK